MVLTSNSLAGRRIHLWPIATSANSGHERQEGSRARGKPSMAAKSSTGWCPELLQRAQRFPVRIRILYCSLGGTDWCEGRTEDISHSGVLFAAEQPLPPKTEVEMRLIVPPAGGGTGAEIVCRGSIVRVLPADDIGTFPRLAATITDYKIARRSTCC